MERCPAPCSAIWVLGAGLVERGALGAGSVEGRGSACAAFSSFCRSSAVASAAAPRSRGRPSFSPSPSAAASPPASRLAAKALGVAPTRPDMSGTCAGHFAHVRDTTPHSEGRVLRRAPRKVAASRALSFCSDSRCDSRAADSFSLSVRA